MDDSIDVAKRCAVLKNLPCDIEEPDVRACLDDAPIHKGLDSSRYQHHDFARYPVQDDDVRWIILFKSEKEASEVIEAGSWKYKWQDNEFTVTPDQCSECIVPTAWIQSDSSLDDDNDEVNDVSDEQNNDSSSPFYSFDSKISLGFEAAALNPDVASNPACDRSGTDDVRNLSSLGASFSVISYDDETINSGSLFGYELSLPFDVRQSVEKCPLSTGDKIVKPVTEMASCDRTGRSALDVTSQEGIVQSDDDLPTLTPRSLSREVTSQVHDSNKHVTETKISELVGNMNISGVRKEQFGKTFVMKSRQQNVQTDDISGSDDDDDDNDGIESIQEKYKPSQQTLPTDSPTDDRLLISDESKPVQNTAIQGFRRIEADNENKSTEWTEDFLDIDPEMLKKLGNNKSATISSVVSADLFGYGNEQSKEEKTSSPVGGSGLSPVEKPTSDLLEVQQTTFEDKQMPSPQHCQQTSHGAQQTPHRVQQSAEQYGEHRMRTEETSMATDKLNKQETAHVTQPFNQDTGSLTEKESVKIHPRTTITETTTTKPSSDGHSTSNKSATGSNLAGSSYDDKSKMSAQFPDQTSQHYPPMSLPHLGNPPYGHMFPWQPYIPRFPGPAMGPTRLPVSTASPQAQLPVATDKDRNDPSTAALGFDAVPKSMPAPTPSAQPHTSMPPYTPASGMAGFPYMQYPYYPYGVPPHFFPAAQMYGMHGYPYPISPNPKPPVLQMQPPNCGARPLSQQRPRSPQPLPTSASNPTAVVKKSDGKTSQEEPDAGDNDHVYDRIFDVKPITTNDTEYLTPCSQTTSPKRQTSSKDQPHKMSSSNYTPLGQVSSAKVSEQTKRKSDLVRRQDSEEHIYHTIDSVSSTSAPSPPPIAISKHPKRVQTKSSSHTLRILEESGSSDEESPSQDVKQANDLNPCILVTGLPDNLTSEMVQLFFENRNRSGGGEIKMSNYNQTKGQAIIEFQDPTVAANVIQKASGEGIKLPRSDRLLSVCAYVPPPKDPLLLFMAGVGEDTNDETISLYLETTGALPRKLTRGLTPGTLLAEFESPPDVDKIRKFCEKRPCDSHTLKVSEVEQTRKVKVTGFHPNTAMETIELYFESSSRSRGGEVECVEKHLDDEAYILTFKNRQDALRVCQQDVKHVVDDHDLSVCLYLPCMDRDPSSVVTIPEPIIVDCLDTYVVRFLKASVPYKDRMVKCLLEVHGAPVWNQDENGDHILTIACTVDPREVRARRMVKTWQEKCLTCVQWAEQEIIVNMDILVALENWQAVISQLGGIKVADPTSVVVISEKKLNRIVITGLKQSVEELSNQIHAITRSLEEQMARENQEVTKVKTLRHFEVALVRATHLLNMIKKEAVGVELNMDTRELIIKGKTKNVESALQKLDSALKGFARQEVLGFSKLGMDLLFMREIRDYIKKQLGQMLGVWDVVHRGQKLIMYSRNESQLKQVIQVLKSSLKEGAIAVDAATCKKLNKEGDQSIVSKIQNENPGLVKIVVEKTEIRVASVHYLYDRIVNEIERYTDSCQIMQDVIQCDSGRFNYLENHRQREVRDLMSQYARQGVTIEVLVETKRKGYLIKGKKEPCRNAIQKVNRMLDNVSQTQVTFDLPGFDRFIESAMGKDALAHIETTDKCTLRYVLDDARDSSDYSDYAFAEQRPSFKKAPRGQKGISIKVVSGSIITQRVDVIVNSTNRDMNLRLGFISSQLLKAAGQSLQDECKSRYPEGLQYGEVGETSAGDINHVKAIFHGILPSWNGGGGQVQAILVRFVMRCLAEADRKQYQSIAFPALGTGKMGYPCDIVADDMYTAVSTYSTKHPNTTIKKVLFVVWEGDTAVVKAFKASEQNHQQQQGGGIVLTLGGEEEDFVSRGPGIYTSIGAVSLQVLQEDLTGQKTDVIVNSVQDNLELSRGAVSTAILKKAGKGLQTEILSGDNPKSIVTEGLVVTGPGKLLCRNIVHLRARSSEKGWISSLARCLAQVEAMGHNSVSFPALGTGGKGMAAEDMGKTMYSAFKQYIESKRYQGCLKAINIVIYESAMLDQFITAVKTACGQAPDKKKWYDPSRLWSKPEHANAPSSRKVTIQVYTHSQSQAKLIEGHLKELRSEENIPVAQALFEELTSNQVREIQRCAREHSKVIKTKDGFRVMGYGRVVAMVRRDIDLKIGAWERDMKIKAVKSSVAIPRNWSKMSPGEQYKIVQLAATDPDYKTVATAFNGQAAVNLRYMGGMGQTIVKIERIQNPHLHAQYTAKKKQMEGKGQQNVEKMLWHGTRSLDVVNKITQEGFNRSYNSGASHGAGVYFAVQSQTSLGYCNPGTAGQKFMFYANVLTGDYCVGSQGIRVPPQKPGGNQLDTYDSTTNSMGNPGFFVVFHDSQAYPSFLVTFQ